MGAPPDLLAATQRAALDEIEHARISFALATAYGGRPVGPAALAALPGACRSLADIARTTFIDACVGESVASARHELRATVLREVVIPCSVALLSAASQDTAQLSRRNRDFVAA